MHASLKVDDESQMVLGDKSRIYLPVATAAAVLLAAQDC